MRCHAMRCHAMILVDTILRDGFARRCQTMRWYGTANEIKAMTIGCIVRRLAIVAMFPNIFESLNVGISWFFRNRNGVSTVPEQFRSS